MWLFSITGSLRIMDKTAGTCPCTASEQGAHMTAPWISSLSSEQWMQTGVLHVECEPPFLGVRSKVQCPCHPEYGNSCPSNPNRMGATVIWESVVMVT